MFLISWNVAGWGSTARLIRSDFGTIAEFLRHTQADIVCLQEVKGSWQKLKDEPYAMGAGDGRPVSVEGWESFWSFSGRGQRGFNGVATFARKGLTWWCDSRPFIEADDKEGNSSPDASDKKTSTVEELHDEGRVLVTGHSAFVLVNTYVVNGRNSQRMAFKMRFLSCLKSLLARLKKENGKPVILVGDLNITFRAEDSHWSQRRLGFPSFMRLVHLARSLSNDEWKQSYPYIGQDTVCHLEGYIAEQTLQFLVDESDDPHPNDGRCARVDNLFSGLTKECKTTVTIDGNHLLQELVQKGRELKYHQNKGSGARVTLSELCEAGVTSVFASTLLRMQQTNHNRDIFVLVQYCGLPSHDEAGVEFMKELLVDLNLRDTMLVGLTPEALNDVCPCPYTCWDQSKNKRVVNEGNRIDYILIDASLAPKLAPCRDTENNVVRTLSEGIGHAGEDNGKKVVVDGCENTSSPFFSEFDGASHLLGVQRTAGHGAYPAAAMDGTGLPPLKKEARDLQFRGLPSTGLFVTPPQYSDHCGVCAYFPDLLLEPRPAKVKEIHPCLYRPPASLESFFQKRPRSE
ncbi:DNA-(apurinic or apyrimidinic site) lyase [Trypanosoma brucei equiperdum]|uniref:DNA-(Apurinic or apyrimidinic site) lyase n=1 Tax=Trypanosoma brucei equiperdum TaxID=630700 RepID=A0A3L6KY28_9TRYP|nr:DNA-(apurinic or apyrimidinic site) lyase [Trypanosoma brucei equiperdum]